MDDGPRSPWGRAGISTWAALQSHPYDQARVLPMWSEDAGSPTMESAGGAVQKTDSPSPLFQSHRRPVTYSGNNGS